MTTFLFMLTPETERLLAEQVLASLKLEFPNHGFEAGIAEFEEFENSILPVRGAARNGENPDKVDAPSTEEIMRVQGTFDMILSKLKD